jgi:hypothetical protein
MDVSNRIDVTDAEAVNAEVRGMLQRRYPGEYQFGSIDILFRDFSRLYSGEYPGFHACDIKYHDSQHVLDVTLAMARLIDGYDCNRPVADRLGECFAIAGIACALFHDAGYIRRKRDTRHKNGAAYTRVHVSRSARFLKDYLPTVGLGEIAPLCARLVHFTGYEVDPARLKVESDQERTLGHLLGTADLIAQMADIDYPRKCRDHLYEEFAVGGMAGDGAHSEHNGAIYRSPEQLLAATPNFIRSTIDARLDGQFAAAYRHVEVHFGGRNLYMEAIRENCSRLEALLAQQGAVCGGVSG